MYGEYSLGDILDNPIKNEDSIKHILKRNDFDPSTPSNSILISRIDYALKRVEDKSIRDRIIKECESRRGFIPQYQISGYPTFRLDRIYRSKKGDLSVNVWSHYSNIQHLGTEVVHITVMATGRMQPAFTMSLHGDFTNTIVSVSDDSRLLAIVAMNCVYLVDVVESSIIGSHPFGSLHPRGIPFMISWSSDSRRFGIGFRDDKGDDENNDSCCLIYDASKCEFINELFVIGGYFYMNEHGDAVISYGVRGVFLTKVHDNHDFKCLTEEMDVDFSQIPYCYRFRNCDYMLCNDGVYRLSSDGYVKVDDLNPSICTEPDAIRSLLSGNSEFFYGYYGRLDNEINNTSPIWVIDGVDHKGNVSLVSLKTQKSGEKAYDCSIQLARLKPGSGTPDVFDGCVLEFKDEATLKGSLSCRNNSIVYYHRTGDEIAPAAFHHCRLFSDSGIKRISTTCPDENRLNSHIVGFEDGSYAIFYFDKNEGGRRDLVMRVMDPSTGERLRIHNLGRIIDPEYVDGRMINSISLFDDKEYVLISLKIHDSVRTYSFTMDGKVVGHVEGVITGKGDGCAFIGTYGGSKVDEDSIVAYTPDLKTTKDMSNPCISLPPMDVEHKSYPARYPIKGGEIRQVGGVFVFIKNSE